jgi:hypothetical protein
MNEFDSQHFITDPTHSVDDNDNDLAKNVTVNEAWNGVAYECHMCHSLFWTPYGLAQHLASPRHQMRIYVCPQTNCHEHFSALSGLCQHIDGGMCGANQDQNVQSFVDRFIRGIGDRDDNVKDGI